MNDAGRGMPRPYMIGAVGVGDRHRGRRGIGARDRRVGDRRRGQVSMPLLCGSTGLEGTRGGLRMRSPYIRPYRPVMPTWPLRNPKRDITTLG